ncbi:MAG: ABC transporter permease subunit [Planctomycetes bacterium]|nr:ABC transporter permease subunit [Planctomycetota bacterium]
MIATAWTVARRELAAFFYSPIAYGIATIVLLLNGVFFYIYLSHPAVDGDLKQTIPFFYGGFLFYWFLALLVPPILTMRLFAEEKRSGTIEMLMTAPVTDAAVVLGKYAGVLAYYAALWLPSLLYFLLVRALGGEPDFGLVASCLLGTLLVGALFLSIGLFASACTSNQVLAAAAGLVLNLLLFFLPLLATLAIRPATKELLERFSIYEIVFSGFLTGLVDTAHVVYFVSLAGFFLFLTVRVVEARKWK